MWLQDGDRGGDVAREVGGEREAEEGEEEGGVVCSWVGNLLAEALRMEGLPGMVLRRELTFESTSPLLRCRLKTREKVRSSMTCW